MVLFVSSGRTLANNSVGTRFHKVSGEAIDDALQAEIEAVTPGRIAELIAAGVLKAAQDTLTNDEKERLFAKRGRA